MDALIGEAFGNLFYAENRAGEGQPFQFNTATFGYQNIDVGQSSRPQIIDMNRDGLADLVIGERNGNLNYFENIGTTNNPIFPEDPTNNFFGKVDTREINQVTGYSVPTVLEMEGNYQLYVGNEIGKILVYDNLDGNLNGTFTQTNTNFGNVKVGGEIHPTFADIDKDGFLEMAIGNFRGGLTFFKTDLRQQLTNTQNLADYQYFAISPNPVDQVLRVQLDIAVKPRQIRVYNTLGQLIVNQYFTKELAISNLTSGVYVLEVLTDGGVLSKQFIKR